MTRWLLILLIWALPLQLSFAAVAPYCAHEQGVAAQHFGHHQHDHQASASQADGPDQEPSALPGADPDCGYCHHAGSAAPPLPLPVLLNRLAQVHPADDAIDFVSFIADLIPPPDRVFPA